LRRLGWKVRVLWECETTVPRLVARKLGAIASLS
jgi:hypothetical protein